MTADVAHLVQRITKLLAKLTSRLDFHGHAFGGSVVRHGFPRDQDLTYGFVEGTLTF